MMPDAIILCGGSGLRSCGITGNDPPNAMARVAGRPFLELLLLQLKRHSIFRIILSVGYQQDVIRNHFGGNAFGLQLVYSPEALSLGTGGALGQASYLITSDNALVMNGDSYTDLDLCRLVLTHARNQADVTVALVPGTFSDPGSVLVDGTGRITISAEKSFVQGAHYRSAGIYVANRNLLAGIPRCEQRALEQRLCPAWIDEGSNVRAFIHKGTCVDIGTPERYLEAQTILAHAETQGFAWQREL